MKNMGYEYVIGQCSYGDSCKLEQSSSCYGAAVRAVSILLYIKILT